MSTDLDRLTWSLVCLAAAGQRPRCGDVETHHLWTSDEPADRELAAAWCAGCPVLVPCAEVGQGERWGVWGGQDRSPRTYRVRDEAA